MELRAGVSPTSYVWKSALVLTLVVAGLWTATHGVAGAAWGDVLTVLRNLRLGQVAALAAIWLAGLGVYATVLSAALPGLGVRRSLLLNLSGSAVANVIPFGGAVATGLNWHMVRNWGHSNLAFATFCVLTNALDVATKLVLPVVAVVGLALVSGHVPTALWVVASVCAAILFLTWVVQGAVLRTGPEIGSATLTRSDQRPTRQLASVLDPLRQTGFRTRELLLEHWGRLLPASLGYVGAQVVLLEFSLRAVGLHAPLTVVLMAAAIERLSSLVPFTPGGAGVAEIGTIAWLVANGLDPVEVVAGVLVYRFFLIAMEVPLGGLLLGGWAWLQRAPRRATAT
ncbi:MAG: lysylphosphatidylglycerol synthase transmembrane domain-containing protein [Marmoricola sp.]